MPGRAPGSRSGVLSGTRRGAHLSPWQATLWLVGLLTLLRLWVAGRFGFTGDEAHYALYGVKLAWSYFDHPPMVGWLQAVALLFGDSVRMMRVMPILLGAGTMLALYRLTRELYPESSPWVAFVAVAVMQSGIILNLMGMIMLPDSPLMLFGLLAATPLYRAIHRGEERQWLWVGLWFGLAGLSKYTAITLVATALLYALMERQWRFLRSPRFWLGILIAALLILPVLGWNYTHDFISFRYQFNHGMGKPVWSLKRFFTTQAVQLVAYSPGIYLAGTIGLLLALRRSAAAGSRFLAALALPVLVLFGWGSGYQMSLPHWTAFGWIAASPIIARWLVGRWGRPAVKAAGWLSGGYSVVLLVAIYSQLAHPWIPFRPWRNPFSDLYGWRQATQQAVALTRQMGKAPGPKPVLFAGNWSFASHIAWYSRPLPVQVTESRMDQSVLWFGHPKRGARGVLVVPAIYFKRPGPAGLHKFDRCTLDHELDIRVGGRPAAGYRLYRCEGYHG